MSLTVSLDQIIPFSQARANLAEVIDKAKNRQFLVVTKRQKPEIALINTIFLDKLISVYKNWQREREFAEIMNLALKDSVSESQVMLDAVEAVTAVRKLAKKK